MGSKCSSAPCSSAPGTCSTILVPMAFRTRVWTAGKLLVLGGALLATYIVFAVASMRLALRAREVQVPDLTQSHRERSDRDRRRPRLVGSGRRKPPPRPEDTGRPRPRAGPAAGQRRRGGQRSVRVWLSAGQRAAIVPALNGQTERSAQLRLAQDGLAVDLDVSEIRSDGVSRGRRSSRRTRRRTRLERRSRCS